MKIERYNIPDSTAETAYMRRDYIVTYSGVYAIHYCDASRMFYGNKVYHRPGIGKRGKYEIIPIKEVNARIGVKVFWEAKDFKTRRELPPALVTKTSQPNFKKTI